MVEIGGTNPPFLLREEVKPDNRPLLPPNYVSLRQLRERRLKEEQEKEKEKEKVKQSDNYVSLRQLRDQRLKEDKEKEMVKGKEKENETDNCAHVPPNYVFLRQLQEWRLKGKKEKENGREEDSEDRPRFPPNYVSLKQLQEQRLKEEKENEKEKEKEDNKVREKMIGEEKGEKNSLLPPNYISLRQLRELRLQEKEEVPKARIEQTKLQKEGDESGQIEAEINKKACDVARSLQSNCKRGCGKSSWVWEPVHPPAGASSCIGVSSVDSVFLPENADVSHEVVMALFDQNEDAEMKLRKKTKTRKKHSRKMFSGKDNGELVQGSELLTEVTDLKIGKAINASSNATKDVTVHHKGRDHKGRAVKKGKGGDVNLTKSSNYTIPVLVQKKKFNGVQSMGFKMRNGRDKGKGKEVNLSEQNHNVVLPLSEVAKGSDGVEEVIGSKIETVEQKGKGKMINIPELSDQTPCHEDAKGILGAGEVIGSENWNVKEEKGMGKNVNLPESSEWGGQIGGNRRKRNQAAGIRGRGHLRAGGFAARPGEHLRGGGSLVWVPKNSS